MSKLAVFDVDGTLVDSRAILQAASQTAFRAIGREPPPYDALRQIVGLSLPEGLSRLAPELKGAEAEALTEQFRESVRALHRDPNFFEPLYPGAADLLNRLKREGWRIGIATGKTRRGLAASFAMHGWTDLFDCTGCSDDGPGKPDPFMLREVMRKAAAEPACTVMVGDTTHDVCMARAAGVRSIAVTWGFHTREELQAARPDRLVDDFAALAAELDGFAAAPLPVNRR